MPHPTLNTFLLQILAALQVCVLASRAQSVIKADLALLVAIRQQLQTVCGDGQELRVGLLQQRDHPLQSVGQTHGHLGSLLVQQQVVKCGDGVEQHRL